MPSSKLGTVLRSLGFTPTEAEVGEMAGDCGATMSFDALAGCIAKAKATTPDQEQLLSALQAFDHTGSGTIRVADLK